MKHVLKLDMLHDNNCSFSDKKVMKKTVLGAFFTILVTITYIILNYQIIYDYFTNKTSMMLKNEVNDADYVQINMKNIPLKYVVTDTNGELVPPGFITITTKYKFYDYYSDIFRSEERILKQSVGPEECGFDDNFLNKTQKGAYILINCNFNI